jgi:uncharacterized protein (TIGR02996 family)
MNQSPLTPWLGNPDFEAFAAAIAATPDDDAPRLVLADWLEERGDDESGRLARDPRFVVFLAMARWQKATGIDFAASVKRIYSAFEEAGKLLLPALQRMGEVFRDMEAARAAAAPKRRGAQAKNTAGKKKGKAKDVLGRPKPRQRSAPRK